MSLVRREPQEVAGKESTIEYKNLEVGPHEGRLVFVADLGLQRKEYAGEFIGLFQQLALGIEVLGKTFKKDGEEHPVMLWTRPFYVYSELTEKGKELEYYSAFDPMAEEGQQADWDKVLGMPVTVVISHTKDKKDPTKKYDNIARLQAIPAQYHGNVPEAMSPLASGDGPVVVKALYGLTKFVFDRRLDGGRQYEADARADAQTTNPNVDNNFDDDIPF